MLSRVAESLYWMARYIERAEAVARLAAVDFQALLDGARRGRLGRRRAHHRRRRPLPARVPGGRRAAPSSSSSMLAPREPERRAAPACPRARENARGVREQISSEMWEHLNRLYLLARDGRGEAWREGPYDFFRQVRDGSQAFEGITAATMTHGEAYEFIQLGRYLERAAITMRIAGRALRGGVHAGGRQRAAASLELITLLKSCGAFEPFRRQPRAAAPGRARWPSTCCSTPSSRAPCSSASSAPRARCGRGGRRRPCARTEKLDPPARLLGRLRAGPRLPRRARGAAGGAPAPAARRPAARACTRSATR